ncbi:hypothetical protein L0Y65_01050 [Candidatus Micrarchaeota archaeon]|nr:hypothetical protein [Candidatus Micrarchaeota archaeon]
MVKLSLRCHPDVLFGFSSHHVELILRAENPGARPVWAEADVSVPERLSLSPNNQLRKGRLRIGIVGKGEYLEKSVRIYSNSFTNPQMYKSDVTLFAFNRDGVIEERLEKSINVRCELKKEASM